MKPAAESDPSLREEGLFVFELDDRPERAFCVKADGALVPMDPDGHYRLRKAPSEIEVELCAGPIYTPPLRGFLARYSAACPACGAHDGNHKFSCVYGPVKTIPALLGDGPVQRGVARKVPMGEDKQSALAQLWDDEVAGAKAIAVHDMRARGVPEAAAKAIAEGLYGAPVDGCKCPWWDEMPCPVHGDGEAK